VNDVSDARERAHRFRSKQSVGIRDEADRCHLPQIVLDWSRARNWGDFGLRKVN
jgi:hypothetical protein